MDLMREKHVVEMGEHKEQRDRMMYDYEQQLEAQTAAYAQDREELGRLLQKAVRAHSFFLLRASACVCI